MPSECLRLRAAMCSDSQLWLASGNRTTTDGTNRETWRGPEDNVDDVEAELTTRSSGRPRGPVHKSISKTTR